MELWEGGRSFKEYLQVNKDNINFTDLMWRSLKLCLVFEKCEGNKIEKKSGRKEKIDLKLINYFYIFLQTHFTLFPSD